MKTVPPVRPRAALGFRAKLFALAIGLTLVGLLGAQLYASKALALDMQARVLEDLDARAELVAQCVGNSSAFTHDPVHAAAPLVRELAAASHARVTLVAPDGRVVADSEVLPEDIDRVANHGARPEVQAARSTGRGVSTRQSNTVHRPLTYLAVRVPHTEGAPWVMRLAIAPALIDTQRATLYRLLLVAGVVGLLIAGSISFLAVPVLSQPVRALTSTARAMLRDHSVRTNVRQNDEVGDLAAALDELADGLTLSLEDLRQQRDQLEAILEAMAEGVLVIDRAGTIVLANHALRAMFLLGPDVIGRATNAVIRDAELGGALAEAARSRDPVSREIEVRGLRARRVLMRSATVQGNDDGTVAVLSDVTELRRLETMRRDFVANVSHELRTPIAAVRAAVETLQDGALRDENAAAEFVSIIDRHAQRLHRIVEDLLELSRIEAKELALKVEALDIAEEIEHAAELFELPADRKQTGVETHVAKGLPRVAADKNSLEHVLSNLIDNAIKYSPEQSRVTIRAQRHEGRVRVSVEDSGGGIDAHHLPRLFERFYRVDNGRSRALGGTGLGLAIVKHLSESMGASVSVESEVGRGTRFHVDLRVAEG